MTSGISKSTFEKLSKLYRYYSSWCVWEKWDENDFKFTSNIKGCMEWSKDKDLIKKLNDKCILVALNCSGNIEDYDPELTKKTPWDNFHSGSCDCNLRYALWNSEYYGSYITDLAKFEDFANKIPFKNSKSKVVIKTLNENPELLKKNINLLKEEIRILGNVKTIIALGRETYNFLKEYKDTLDVKNIVYACHYSANCINRLYNAKYSKETAQAAKYKQLFWDNVNAQLSKH